MVEGTAARCDGLQGGRFRKIHVSVTARRSTWTEHLRRGIAIGLAVSLHLLVLMLVVGPKPAWRRDVIRQTGTQRLYLRFFSTRVAASPATSVATPSVAAINARPHPRRFHVVPPPMIVAQPAPSVGPAALPDVVIVPSAPTATEDGGFHQRLMQSPPDPATRIPGSDVPLVRGIHLTDPDTQGMAAVVRKTQRLFGITSSHCIDVDAWRRLSPDELHKRHLSTDDLDRLEEQYQCNRPMGLSF
jgi:hypothetical protein